MMAFFSFVFNFYFASAHAQLHSASFCGAKFKMTGKFLLAVRYIAKRKEEQLSIKHGQSRKEIAGR